MSVFRIGVHVWCLHKKGPVYVAMFKPLGIAIAVAMVVLFLGDALYLGRYVVEKLLPEVMQIICVSLHAKGI